MWVWDRGVKGEAAELAIIHTYEYDLYSYPFIFIGLYSYVFITSEYT